MARAKRTDRADARRRTRHTHLADDGSAETPMTTATTGHAPDRPPTTRPSITAAFRNAYHPANIREDLAALPRLLRTRAFFISLGLILAGAVAVAVAPRSEFTLTYFSLAVLDPQSGTPGMLPIMLVGFLATRASYLLGLILGLIDVAVGGWFAYVIAPLLVENPADAVAFQSAIPATIPLAASFGILFAAAAAWYRRFLALSNASAARARQERARAAASKKGR